MKIKNCQWCKNEFTKKHSKKYCNNKCQNNFENMNRFLDWYYGIDTKRTNRALRDYLETIYGHKCSECGITHWLGEEIVFDVDHVDGNSSNNNKENVRLLCQNCHSQTETHSKSDSGIGRYSLMKMDGNKQ